LTIEILKKLLEEAVNNGLGDYPIYARCFGDSDKNRKEIEFAQIVSSDEKYGEIIYRRKKKNE
jgi:hypothetical protein